MPAIEATPLTADQLKNVDDMARRIVKEATGDDLKHIIMMNMDGSTIQYVNMKGETKVYRSTVSGGNTKN